MTNGGTGKLETSDMAKNKTFTGGKRSARTPTLNKDAQFQIIRLKRNLMKEVLSRGEEQTVTK